MSHAAPSRESAAIAVVAELAESRIQRQNPPQRRKRTPVMHRSGYLAWYHLTILPKLPTPRLALSSAAGLIPAGQPICIASAK
jgi:hypothetical protein